MEENNNEINEIPKRSTIVKVFGIVILITSIAMIISHIWVAKSFINNLIDDNVVFAIFKILLLIIMILIEIVLTLFGLYVLYDSKI